MSDLSDIIGSTCEDCGCSQEEGCECDPIFGPSVDIITEDLAAQDPTPTCEDCQVHPEGICAGCRFDPFDDGHMGVDSVWAVWPGMHPAWGM